MREEQSFPYHLSQSAAKFESAQRRAFIQHVLSLLTGRPDELLSFGEVRRVLQARQERDQGTRFVPLDRIVGSEGRYHDFTRTFLPREGADKRRWMRLDRALNVLEDIPPIDVYQLGDVYFVKDGHHRVSVARANGIPEIEAWVTKLETPVSLEPSMRLRDIVVKAAAAEFAMDTGLTRLRPDAHVVLTEPGLYGHLREHIAVHRHYLGLEQQREIPYEEAATSWYDNVYLPVVHAIRDAGVMAQFPDRTESDMYLWITRRREELQERYGPGVYTEDAVVDVRDERAVGPWKSITEWLGQLAQAPRRALERWTR